MHRFASFSMVGRIAAARMNAKKRSAARSLSFQSARESTTMPPTMSVAIAARLAVSFIPPTLPAGAAAQLPDSTGEDAHECERHAVERLDEERLQPERRVVAISRCRRDEQRRAGDDDQERPERPADDSIEHVHGEPREEERERAVP